MQVSQVCENVQPRTWYNHLHHCNYETSIRLSLHEYGRNPKHEIHLNVEG